MRVSASMIPYILYVSLVIRFNNCVKSGKAKQTNKANFYKTKQSEANQSKGKQKVTKWSITMQTGANQSQPDQNGAKHYTKKQR